MSRLDAIQNKIHSLLEEDTINLKRLSFYYEKEKELREYVAWCRTNKVEPIGV